MLVAFQQTRVHFENRKTGTIILELQGGNPLNLHDIHKAVDDSDLTDVGRAAMHNAIEKIAVRECVMSHLLNDVPSFDKAATDDFDLCD